MNSTKEMQEKTHHERERKNLKNGVMLILQLLPENKHTSLISISLFSSSVYTHQGYVNTYSVAEKATQNWGATDSRMDYIINQLSKNMR